MQIFLNNTQKMEAAPTCLILDSDEWTDAESCESSGGNETDNPIDLYKHPPRINGNTTPHATNNVQNSGNEDDNSGLSSSNGIEIEDEQCSKDPCMDDFEFDFQFIDEAEQTEHILNVRVHAKFCMRCGTGFVQQKTLNKHIAKNECSAKKFSIEMPLTCSICGQGFIGYSCLRQHVMRHAQTKPFKCKECSRSFITQRSLYSHYRTHKGYRPFICDLCPKTYLSARHLAAHRRHHAGEHPYACKLCSKRFNKLSRLTVHKREHASKKPFKCKFCYRSYAQNSKRNLHMRTHTRSKSGIFCYLCEVCGLTHVTSKVSYIKVIPGDRRNSVICLDEDSEKACNTKKQKPEKTHRRESTESSNSSGSSDSVQIIEDPLQITIDLVDE